MRRITRITDVLCVIPGIVRGNIEDIIESQQVKINDSIATINSACIDDDIIHYPNGKVVWKSEYFLKGSVD